MNIKEINPGTKGTLPYFFAVVTPLMLMTICLSVAVQIQSTMSQFKFNHDEGDKTEGLERQ